MPDAEVDLGHPRRIHIVGVGGSGMSAIASVLVAMGHRVSGSDLTDSPTLARLADIGVRTWAGHEAAAVGDAELLAISTAIPATNVEVVEARRRRLPVLRRAEVLAAICATKRTLAVAGTHGKTTTSSMLARVLGEAGLDPSYIIGGDIHGIGPGAAWRSGSDWLVVEADESDGTFLALPTAGVIVTSVEADHLDYYGDLAHLVAAFEDFAGASAGPRVIEVDHPAGAALAASLRSGPVERSAVTTYGVAAGADYCMSNFRRERHRVRFALSERGAEPVDVEIGVPGDHNAANACGAIAMARAIGVTLADAVSGVARYQGVARRFEWRGERLGISYVDDYGHLPGEVAAVLATARAGGWRRVVAVFQPHRYSRTESLWPEFADAFVDADRVIVTDVYAAGEQARPGISGQLIVDAICEAHPDTEIDYCPEWSGLVELLRATLEPGDLCLTLGAGDLTTLADQLLAEGE